MAGSIDVPRYLCVALRRGAPIEGIELPASDSLRDQVSYAVGALENARRRGRTRTTISLSLRPRMPVPASGSPRLNRMSLYSGRSIECARRRSQAVRNEQVVHPQCFNLTQAQVAETRSFGRQFDGGDHAEFTMAPAISFCS